MTAFIVGLFVGNLTGVLMMALVSAGMANIVTGKQIGRAHV